MVSVLIPCAGKGERLGALLPKQYLPLKGIPLFIRTLMVFDRQPDCSHIILSISQNFKEYIEELLLKYSIRKVSKIVEGGDTRQESVYKALLAAPEDTEIFLVHDAVRPFVPPELIKRVIEETRIHACVLPAIPVRDALIRVSQEFVEEPVSRVGLYLVQTPQGIRADLLKECLERASLEGLSFPDEGSLLHYYGYKVKVISGALLNFKITYPEDFLLAEKLISE
jgi:2-C-methyl-D-erythritol 4-phosphate cytidylyltransferase